MNGDKEWLALGMLVLCTRCCTQACLLVHYITVRLFYSCSSSSLIVRLLGRLPLAGLESGTGAGWMFIFFYPFFSGSCIQSGRMDGLYVL